MNRLDITLVHGSAAEARTRTALRALVRRHELEPWVFTRDVAIDESAVPHSHPVLTINTDYRGDQLLATFIHEQLHWFEESVVEARDRAIEETRGPFPEVPSQPPDGASDEVSTRLHLIVCHLEYRAMQQLVGEKRAHATLAAWRHYRWVYRTVLSEPQAIASLVERCGLIPPGLMIRPP